MQTEKIQEIAELFINNPGLTADEVMNGYIFGIYAKDEHYNIDEIQDIKNTVVTLTALAVVEAPVELEAPLEEPVIQPTVEEIVQELLA